MAIALVNLSWIDSVSAITREIELSSEQGYRIETSFSYDADQAQKAIAAQGKGATQDLDSLQVRFYNPDGEMIASYDNIVDGVVQANYFEFHYDRTTQRLLGAIDLGGESPGEIYLKGNALQKLALMKIEPSGEERVMDSWEVGSNE